jgi:hypothetical protein
MISKLGNGNNMNNKKTIKNYAVLTAVFFTLSFVTIDNAQANEEVSYDRALELLDQYEDELTSKQSTSELSVEDTKALKRIELTKELVIYDKYRNKIPEKYNTYSIDKKISELLDQITGVYASNVVIEAETELAPDYLAFGYGTDWSHNPSAFNCSIQANSNADHDGWQYSVSSTTLNMWNDFIYPSTFSEGSIPCPAKDYDHSYAGILSYRSPYPTCTSNIYDYHDATVFMNCNGHNFDNALALVTTNAFYDNGAVEFDEEWSLILP